MAGVAGGTEREQVIRWMEERMAIVKAVREILRERDQFKAAAETAQEECNRLRHEVEKLRGEVRRLTVERAEMAQWLAARITEAAARLRSEPPPA